MRDWTGEPTAPDAIYSDYDDDPDLQPIIDEFLAHIPLDIAELRRAVSANDPVKVACVAHQLRGAGGNVGFMPLSDAAARVEIAASRRDPELERAVEALVQVCRAARAGSAR